MATKTTRRNRKRRGYAVDFHAHIVLPEAVAFAARHGMVREVSRMVRFRMLPTIKAWE